MKGIAFYNQTFLFLKEDEALLKENITRILLTLPGERINNPIFGSKLRAKLFSLDVYMKEDIEAEITTAINRWEPRVTIDEIITESDSIANKFVIHMVCTNNTTLQTFTYEQILRL